MTSANNSWEKNMQNSTPLQNNQNGQPVGTVKIPPSLPPRPDGVYRSPANNFNMPYAGYGPSSYGSYGGLSSYGGLNSYGSYGMPYSSSMYNSYGGYNNMGMYGPYSNMNEAERRFIQYAEESSRKTFANVENIVRAFSSIAMMLDNTFFAMTSSFRAFLSMADNFGRLRSTFGQIWYSISIFRLFRWLYCRLMEFMGYKDMSSPGAAWRQAVKGQSNSNLTETSTSHWPAVAFLGVLVSAPYIISKFLPKYEDNSNMANWKSPGITARVVFDFVATNPTEMSVRVNDNIILAPTYIQESMGLKNTGWVYALRNGKNGLIPLNYIAFSKSKVVTPLEPHNTHSILSDDEVSSKSSSITQSVLKNYEEMYKSATNTQSILGNDELFNTPSTAKDIPESSKISDLTSNTRPETKSHTKRVSFGENQVFENLGLEDVIRKAENEAKQYRNSSNEDKSSKKENNSNENHSAEGCTS